MFQPVIWIGSHSVAVSKNADADAYPVRIHADAFAAGAPGRDLLVTAEHCIHVDGKLIPVRMLVNERSIVVDRSITRFAYFHVELAKHSILVAEGLETESYLDTGNRTNFSNVPVTALVPDLAIARTTTPGRPAPPRHWPWIAQSSNRSGGVSPPARRCWVSRRTMPASP